MKLERRDPNKPPEPRAGRPLADGTYPATVLEAKETASKAGKLMVMIAFGVEAPPAKAPQGPVKLTMNSLPEQEEYFDDMLRALAPEVLAAMREPGDDEVQWFPDDNRLLHADGSECLVHECPACAAQPDDKPRCYGLRHRRCLVVIRNEVWRDSEKAAEKAKPGSGKRDPQVKSVQLLQANYDPGIDSSRKVFEEKLEEIKKGLGPVPF